MKSTSRIVPKSTAKNGYFVTPVVPEVLLLPSTANFGVLALALAVHARRFKAWSRSTTGETAKPHKRIDKRSNHGKTGPMFISVHVHIFHLTLNRGVTSLHETAMTSLPLYNGSTFDHSFLEKSHTFHELDRLLAIWMGCRPILCPFNFLSWVVCEMSTSKCLLAFTALFATLSIYIL